MTMLINRRELIKSTGLGALALSVTASVSSTASAMIPDVQVPTIVPRAYELPPLPYGYDALAPQIEARVLRVHHDKHHAGYVKGLNATLARLVRARKEGDFARIKALSRALAFHGSGHLLHSLYWQSMRPNPKAKQTKPSGKLGQALERNFGSLEAFGGQFRAAAKKVEGSGWGVLAYEPLGQRLLILQVEKHQNLTIWGVVPLLVCDVWEHAYYVQYQNRRADYVDNFYQLIDWPAVRRRYVACILTR